MPNLQVPLDADGARKMIRVIDALEDSDDVQNVCANGDIRDDVLAELETRTDGVGPRGDAAARCTAGVLRVRPPPV